jgi:REP element-mobilizing transposase RayT
MPRRRRVVEPDSWHHVSNRSIARRPLFETARDVRYFLSRLAREVRRGRIEVHAYSVMTTHFHMLVRCPAGELSDSMQWTQDLYARRFNRARFRDGPLFRGRFRSSAVTTNAYWEAVLAYVDRNAVAAGVVARPSTYPHGSARHHAALSGPPWLSRERVQAHLCYVTGASPYSVGAYDAAILGMPGDADEVVERRLRLGDGDSPDDPLDDLVRAAPRDVQAWMADNARLADGVPAGIVLLASATLRRLISESRHAHPQQEFRATRRRRPVWDVLEPGLLRTVGGLRFDEIALCLGLRGPTTRKRVLEHVHAMQADESYRVTAAEIVHRALAIDFGRCATAGLPPVLRVEHTSSARREAR